MESLLPLPLPNTYKELTPNTYQGLTSLQRIPTLSTNSWKRQTKSAKSENCYKIKIKINPQIYWDSLLQFNLVIWHCNKYWQQQKYSAAMCSKKAPLVLFVDRMVANSREIITSIVNHIIVQLASCKSLYCHLDFCVDMTGQFNIHQVYRLYTGHQLMFFRCDSIF